jgi:hypothetical protein
MLPVLDSASRLTLHQILTWAGQQSDNLMHCNTLVQVLQQLSLLPSYP